MARATPIVAGTAMAEAQQILCPQCYKPNLRRARFCQHCGHDIVLNNDGPSYYITRVLKAGGQGAVFETIGDDNKTYAVKEMLDRSTDPKERAESIQRFEAEADMLRRLSHPRIPKVYVDFKDEGKQYLAMEFVRGEDLEEIIRREGALPEARVLDWADQICDVLGFLHHHEPQPIVFRDMKPSNIMIQPDGTVKLIDFGIAKVFQKAERGTQIGTPGYAPPEQYQGIATPESDIYALGATLHHALTGRDPRDEPPFSFPPVYGLKPTVSKRTSEAIQRALQMKPEDRYHSVAEFRAALRPEPEQPPRVRVGPTAQPQVSSQPAPTASAPAATKPAATAPAPAATTPVTTAAPAAQPSQAARPQSIPQPQASPSSRGRGCIWVIALLLLIVVGVAGVVVAFPGVLEQVAPGVISSPTVTPQTLVLQAYSVDDLEIVVPAGVDVRDAFQRAFLQKAQQEYGPGTQINNNAPPSFVAGSEPVKTGEDSRGELYRASMQGFILVPQGP
ncbi:MAG TPA: serine/threonine-protein kinase [Roseiflexaceae bacterium]|nr:serine/threonine-protein kinase [Roseiflexaceae bacterium]